MRIVTTSFIFLLLQNLCMHSPAVQAETPLQIAYPPFVPFHYSDQSGHLKGFFYDSMTEALENRLDIKLAWTPYPWARFQENVKQGIDDAIITVPPPERSVYLKTHTSPFYQKKLQLFTSVNHPQIKEKLSIRTITDIKQYDFSIITDRGNGLHKKNVESLGIKTVESSSITNIWQMLWLQRGDLVIEWPAAALPDIRQLKLTEQVLDTNRVLAEMPFHLLIRNDSHYVNIPDNFEQTIESMRDDGTLDTILSKYR
jgi:polar amino acid transport system substrate-binding protein